MGDIFDQIAAPKAAAPPPPPPRADIFDAIAQPASSQAVTPQRLSDSLPQPDQVVQEAEISARMLVHAMTTPGAVPGMGGGLPPGPAATPQLPVPWETDLQTNSPSDRSTGILGGKNQLDIPQALLNATTEGAGRLASGIEAMAGPAEALSRTQYPLPPGMQPRQGYPTMTPEQSREGAAGLHQAVTGAFGLATPLMLGAGAAAPVRTALTIGAASKAQEGVEAGLQALGLPEEYAAVAGDLTGLIVAAATHKLSTKVQERVTSTLRTRWQARHALKGGGEATLSDGKALTSEGRAPTSPEQQYTSTGQPIRTPDIFDQVAPAAKAVPTQTAIPAESAPQAKPTTQVARGSAILPSSLKGAKPRYAFGDRQFDLDFENDVDKAAYITAQQTRSKADAGYLAFAMQATGMTEPQVRAHGVRVRSQIKALARDAEPGRLSVPQLERPGIPKETPHAETQVQATDEGRPDAGPGTVQPAAAEPATTEGNATAQVQVGPPPGHVRVYRGEPSGGYPPASDKSEAGRWFTPKRESAELYDKNLRYVDLPVSKFEELRSESDELNRLDPSATAIKSGIVLPAEYANRAEGEPPSAPTRTASPEMPARGTEATLPPEVQQASARLKSRFKNLAGESGEQSSLEDWSADDVKDLAAVGSHYLKQTGGKVKEWTDAMVGHFGEGIRPYLVHAYAAASQQVGTERGSGFEGRIPTSDIQVDAPRFQFKQEGIGQRGVSDQFQDVRTWDPDIAGTVHVWKDPQNGQTYAVNGHHRVDLAKRLGVPELQVRYLDAKTAAEARAKGALINIAEGNGTAIDAAKFFRDTGKTPETLGAEGKISLRKKVAQQGAALANLSQPIFDDVTAGSLPVERAAVIGSGVRNHADQQGLYDLIKKREQGGKRLTNDQIGELIRLNSRTSTVTESTADDAQGGLFGAEEMTRSLLPEKAEVSDYVRKQLGDEKKLFGLVGNENAAAKLGERGNVIKAGENAQVAAQANQGMALYDKLSVHAGPIDAMLDQAAKRLADGEPSGDVKQQAYRQIRDHLKQQLDSLTGVLGVGDRGAEGLRQERPRDVSAGQRNPLDTRGTGGNDAGPAGAVRPESVQQVAPETPKPLTAAEHNARAAALRLKARASKLITDERGEQRNELDPQDLKDLATVGAHYLQEAGGKVKEWADRMVSEFGEGIRPYLQQIHQAASAPHPPEHESTGVYFGSGLGALEPLFRESKAEGDALLDKRNAALAAAKAAAAAPAETKAGEAIRAYMTSERDLWAARANQAIDIVTRRIMPKIQDREALAIMREFRHRPGELQQFIDGNHPFLQDVDGGAAQADKNLAPLMPRMREALAMLTRPLTQRENTTDRLFTNISDKSLQEGKAGGWLGSRWKPDEYVPHLLSEKGTGDVATPPSTAGRIQGKIGKFFGFGERRSDRYPTVVHAVADGIVPKTLDPSAAFTVHADKFAQARATHLLEAHLADSGLGKWGSSENAPEGWVQLAAHSDEFKKHFALEDPNSLDPETGRGEMRVGTQGLYVPPFIDKALSPVTDPDYTAKVPGFAKLRTMQRGLKEAILGLSGFHLLTENAMAAADIGPAGMVRAFRTPRESLGSIMNERDLIAHGGTTSVQGSTMDAYRSLRPGTIPTRAEVIRAYIPGTRTMLDAADAVTRFTFGNVQRRFKIEAFSLHRDAWMRDNPTATPDQLADAKRGIASYVNGVYGGLHWENMGISRAMVEMGRFAFLAPDWSGSNIALAKYAFDARPSANEIPLRNRLAGAVTKESAQARLSRTFWTKQLVGGLLGTQMLSLLFSGKMSQRPFQVYQGDDENGEGVYQNVLFRGSVGDLVNLASKMEDHGLLVGAGTFVGSKAAPVTKLGIHAITGRDDMGREIAPKSLSATANTVRAAGTLAGDVSPVPIALRNVQRTMMSYQSDKYLWSERMLGLFGPQAQHVAPDGMRMTKHGLVPAHQRPDRSIWDEITTGKR